MQSIHNMTIMRPQRKRLFANNENTANESQFRSMSRNSRTTNRYFVKHSKHQSQKRIALSLISFDENDKQPKIIVRCCCVKTPIFRPI